MLGEAVILTSYRCLIAACRRMLQLPQDQYLLSNWQFRRHRGSRIRAKNAHSVWRREQGFWAVKRLVTNVVTK